MNGENQSLIMNDNPGPYQTPQPLSIENENLDKEIAEEHPRKRFLSREKNISTLIQKAEDFNSLNDVMF